MSVTLYSSAMTRVRHSIVNLLMDHGQRLASKIKENIGDSYPPASGHGQFPHRRSGELQDGIVVIGDYDDMTANVVSMAPHGKILEKSGRSFMKRTFEEHGPGVLDGIQRGRLRF